MMFTMYRVVVVVVSNFLFAIENIVRYTIQIVSDDDDDDDDDDVQSRQKKTLIIMCELDMADNVRNILTNVLGVRMSR